MSKKILNKAILGVSALTILGTLSLQEADAASYKLKSAKLVYTSNSKIVKGYKLYKSKLYYNGKIVKGYKLYKSKLYYNGKLKSGYKQYGNYFFYKGVKYTGTHSSTFYKNGVKFTGNYTIKGTTYYYKSGKKLTGLKNNQLYVNGRINKGYTLYKNTLYKDYSVNKGNSVYKKQLYSNGSLAAGNILFKDKFYINGSLANVTIINAQGEQITYVNGVIVNNSNNGNKTSEQIIEKINQSTFTTIDRTNVDMAKEIISAYDKLSPEDRQKVKIDVAKLQQAIETYEKSITLTTDTINKMPTYTEVTKDNVNEAQQILDAYNRLTDTEKGAITYDVDTLQGLVDIYTINSSAISSVNAANVKNVKTILDLYNKLSSTEKTKVSIDIPSLQKQYEAYLKLNTNDYSIITKENIEDAKKLLDEYEKMTPTERLNVTYDVEDIKAGINAYEFDQSTKYDIITNPDQLKDAKSIIGNYNNLTKAAQAKVTYDIANLQAAIDAYNFSNKVLSANTDDYETANDLVKEYETLSSKAKAKVTVSILDNAKVTIEAHKLNASPVYTDITNLNVDNAKDVIASIDSASDAVKAKITYDINTLKANVASYDFKLYYETVFKPNFLQGKYDVLNQNKDLTYTQVPYILRMYEKSTSKVKENYKVEMNAKLDLLVIQLDPNLRINDDYSISNINDPAYKDVTYNYEKTLKYTDSQSK